MKKVTIVMILFLMIFLFENPLNGAVISDLNVNRNKKDVIVNIKTDSKIEPRIRFLQSENCWQLDFVEVTRTEKILSATAFHGPLKLLQCFQIFDDPPIQRISCFVQPSTKMKVRKSSQGFTIRFKSSNEFLKGSKMRSMACVNSFEPKALGDSSNFFEHRVPQPLLPPNEATLEEVNLDLSRARVQPILKELARKAQVTLVFRDLPPNRVTVQARHSTPLAALEAIVEKMNMVLVNEKGDICLYKRENPLLKISASEIMNTTILLGKTVKDSVLLVAGAELAEIILKRLPKRILETTITEIDGQISPREWIGGLISLYDSKS